MYSSFLSWIALSSEDIQKLHGNHDFALKCVNMLITLKFYKLLLSLSSKIGIKIKELTTEYLLCLLSQFLLVTLILKMEALFLCYLFLFFLWMSSKYLRIFPTYNHL